MATAEQLRALLESHVAGDEERFFALFLQVAAQASRQGQNKFADDLVRLVDKAQERRSAANSLSPVPIAQPRGELSGLIGVAYPKALLSDLVLASDVREQLERILLEQRQRAKLTANGLCARRKILLIGPPGTGKTFTATALAGELHVPLFSVLLDGLMTKFMGEAAAKLRLVFDAVSRTRGVYFFDEFDALGAERGNPNDVGEARRTLNSFLQMIEQDRSDSILLAATNHAGLLDRALFRRFDDIIHFDLPSSTLATHLIKARLALFASLNVDWRAAATAAKGLSHAEIVRACDDTMKNAILRDETELTTSNIVASLKTRRLARRK
jgi:SpoVK/Ycf46/Vps4 family AAA+-type ATPase